MANKPLHFTQVKKSKNPPVRILSRFGCFDFTRCPEPDMRRAFLVCGVLYTLASRSTARSAAALFSRRSPPSSAHRYAAIRRKFRQQQRLSTGRETEATKMHFRRATFGGRRLLSLSTRAAFAASAGTYTLPRYPNEPGRDVEMWRNLGSWSGRPSKFAGGWWRPVSHPALSRAAASSSSRTGGDFALGAVDLRTVDGGPIPEGECNNHYRVPKIVSHSTCTRTILVPHVKHSYTTFLFELDRRRDDDVCCREC